MAGSAIAANEQITAKHHVRAESASRVGGIRRTRPPRVGLGGRLVARSGAARFAGFGFLALAWLHEVPEAVERPFYFKRVGTNSEASKVRDWIEGARAMPLSRRVKLFAG